MTCYSVELRDWIFGKSYGCLSLAKNLSKNVGKNINKNSNDKYGQNFLIMLKNLSQILLKLPQKEWWE